jgi:prepilin-type N-terminal cleavage/methylation domain-containing protein
MNLRQKGFTLVELSVVCVLFAIGVLALSQERLYSVKALKQSDSVARATIIANKHIERAQAKGYNYALADSTYTENNMFTVRRRCIGDQFGSKPCRLVEVKVKWQPAKLPADSIMVSTIIPRRVQP